MWCSTYTSCIYQQHLAEDFACQNAELSAVWGLLGAPMDRRAPCLQLTCMKGPCLSCTARCHIMFIGRSNVFLSEILWFTSPGSTPVRDICIDNFIIYFPYLDLLPTPAPSWFSHWSLSLLIISLRVSWLNKPTYYANQFPHLLLDMMILINIPCSTNPNPSHCFFSLCSLYV